MSGPIRPERFLLRDALLEAEDNGVRDPSRVRISPLGYPVYDTPNRTRDGRVPTHRLGAPSGRQPNESWEDYEARVLANHTWSPDTARRSDLAALEPTSRQKIEALVSAAQAAGHQVQIGETRRSQERQEMLFQKGRDTKGDPATWTLTSNHTPGRAADLIVNGDTTGRDPGYAWLHQNAQRFGLQTVDGDPGHVADPDLTPEPPPPQTFAQAMGYPSQTARAAAPARPLAPSQAPLRMAPVVVHARPPLAAAPAPVSAVASPAPRTILRAAAPVAAPAAATRDSLDTEIDAALSSGAGPHAPQHDPLDAEIDAALAPVGAPKDNAAGFLNAVGQGATLGFADEILGGIAGANAKLHGQPYGLAYDAAVAKIRGLSRDYRADQPAGSVAAELLGGAVTLPATGAAKVAGAAGRAGEALSVGQRAVQGIKAGAKAGAAYGAVSGAGSAEGGLANRATGAGVGLTVGAATGGTIGGVAPYLGELLGRGANALAVRTGVRSPQPIVRTPAITGGVTGTVSDAAPSVGERRAAAGAAERLRLQLARDQVTTADIRARAAELRAQGLNPGTIMDLAGENVRGEGRAAHSLPSKARQAIGTALKSRAEGDFGRVQQQLEKGLGGPREDVHTAAQEIVDRRAAAGGPLYQAAMEQPPVEDTDGKIMELLRRPSGQRAYKYAQQIAAEQGRTLPALPTAAASDPIAEIIPAEIRDNPAAVARFREKALKANPALAAQIVEQKAPAIPVETLHHVKLALDDMTHVADRAHRMGTARIEEGGLGPTGIRAMKDTRGELLNLLDQKVPEYKAARDVWAGESALKTALEQGQEASAKKMDHRELGRLVTGMSDSERALFRKGYLDREIAKLEDAKDGRDYVKQIFGAPAERARLRALVTSDQEFTQLETAMKHFANQHETEKITGGSPTARILAEQGDMMHGAGPVVEGAIRGGPRRAAALIYQQIRAPKLAERAEAIAPYLLAGEPGYPSLEEALTAIEGARFGPRSGGSSAASRALVRALSAEEGLRLGSGR